MGVHLWACGTQNFTDFVWRLLGAIERFRLKFAVLYREHIRRGTLRVEKTD
jgi:hypothetical protein